jgi:hypothetical protein
MDRKHLVLLGAAVGGAIGNYIPLLWGASSFSFASIFLSFAGGLGGIWLGFKLGS